jgi:site-specific DNA-cytosine methylase
MMNKINVLSLFDGLGGARISLDQLGINCNYYASEIDKCAIDIHSRNYPETVHLGDVVDIKADNLPNIDLLIGGSPCQSLSGLVNLSDKEKGFDGKSKLFFEYVRILKEVKPKYFVLENVASMKKIECDKISEILGVEPIMINSSLLTAQVRKRYYWTNIPNVSQPIDEQIKLKDILDDGFTEKEKAYCLTATYYNACVQNYFIKSERQHKFLFPIKKETNKFIIDNREVIEIYPSKGADFNRTSLNELKKYTSKLSPVECERLQGVPDNYTQGVSLRERYKMIGNGFTIPVIKHILKNMKF